MKGVSGKIGALIRTNIALAALCIISIGVLLILFKGNGAASSRPGIQSGAAASDHSNASPTQENPSIVSVPLSDMPPPSAFPSFVYETGQTLSISGKCADTYQVLMIFPSGIDYRSDPSSAKYNSAAPCTIGHPYSADVSLESSRLASGTSYYYIKASEGDKGSWHDPY